MPRHYDPEGSADNLADRLQDSEEARLNPEYDLGRDDRDQGDEDFLTPMAPKMPQVPQRKLTNNEAARKMIEARRIKKLTGKSVLNAHKRKR